MNFFSAYEPSLGFRIGIESIHQNPERGFFAVACSINPSASFYDPARRSPPNDLISFTRLNWESISHTQKFDEG